MEDIKSVAKEFESVLAERSEGRIIPKVEVVVLDVPMTEVSSVYERSYWLSPESANKMLEKSGIDSAEYDHVAFIARFNKINAPEYWGSGGVFINDYTGYSFALYLWDMFETRLNYGVMWHEFLHSVESRANRLGYDIPGLHDKEKYPYPEASDDNWNADYMNGRVKNCKRAYHGLPDFMLNLKPTLFN